MIETYLQAWLATRDRIYLAKARSLANSFIKVQQEHNGDYPTYFSTRGAIGSYWINNTVYSARTLLNYQE